MPDEELSYATQVLRRLCAGEDAAADELFPLVYVELHRIAAECMARQPAGHTLQTTALVNEAWLKLARGSADCYESRRHFVRVAASAMRSILVDHARARRTRKRGEGANGVPLGDCMAVVLRDPLQLLAIDEALGRLERLDAGLARIAELRCFGGLTVKEVAAALDQSVRTVERGWRAARAWMQRDLEEGARA